MLHLQSTKASLQDHQSSLGPSWLDKIKISMLFLRLTDYKKRFRQIGIFKRRWFKRVFSIVKWFLILLFLMSRLFATPIIFHLRSLWADCICWNRAISKFRLDDVSNALLRINKRSIDLILLILNMLYERQRFFVFLWKVFFKKIILFRHWISQK